MSAAADTPLLSCVTGSWLVQWWRTPPSEMLLLRHSRVLSCLVWRPWLTAIVLVLASLVLAWVWPGARSALLVFALVAAAGAAWPRAAVLALPTALFWMVRWPAGGVGGETLFFRADQALCFGALLRLIATQRLRETPLYVPLCSFLTALALATVVGILRGTAGNAPLALLYFLHMAQLATVFALSYSMAPYLGRGALYAWGLPLLALAGFGLAEAAFPMEDMGSYAYRTYERFWFHGQANHVGGALALGAIVGTALLREARWRTWGAVLCVACIAALWTTRSRESVVALAFSFALLAAFRFPRPAAIFGVLLLLLLLPLLDDLWMRFTPAGSSLFDRMLHWRSALRTVPEYPLLGLGLGARHRHFYDNQYVMWLAEGGLLVLACFLAWMLQLLRALGQRRRDALALGLFCGVAGMLIQGAAAVVFVATALAGPALWLTGYCLGKEGEAA